MKPEVAPDSMSSALARGCSGTPAPLRLYLKAWSTPFRYCSRYLKRLDPGEDILCNLIDCCDHLAGRRICTLQFDHINPLLVEIASRRRITQCSRLRYIACLQCLIGRCG